MSETAATLLDARGLLCPIPVIRTQDRVKQLTPGMVLDVLATDPGVLHDIPAWCRVHGHEVLETAEIDREIRVRLRVGDRPRRPSRP
jgi:tRNA 2-thiouridine synthesizing protein A